MQAIIASRKCGRAWANFQLEEAKARLKAHQDEIERTQRLEHRAKTEPYTLPCGRILQPGEYSILSSGMVLYWDHQPETSWLRRIFGRGGDAM